MTKEARNHYDALIIRRMDKTEYTEWMKATSPLQREKLLKTVGLPGRLAGQSVRNHDPEGFPVLLALMRQLNPGFPPTMKASMSLLPLDGKWLPFVLVPPGGYDDLTFRHECRHITQFFENPTIRSYFVSAQSVPQEDAKAIAEFGAIQFAGHALAEVEVYRDIDGQSEEGAVFAALNDAVSVLNQIIADGMQVACSRFLAIAETDLVTAAATVAASPQFKGYNVEKLMAKTIERIRRRESPTTVWADLDHAGLNSWIEKNNGVRLGRAEA